MTMTTTREKGIERMEARAAQMPVRTLADALETLDRKAHDEQLDDAERPTRAVLMDVICERCPAAEKAFEAWAQSDDGCPDVASAAIVAAARQEA
jgi:hypothetical protein